MSKSSAHEIRADYDRETIVMYQAYSPAIAEPAVAAQKFVPPFSLQRMTWIKPSFLWLMERSGWGKKAEQEVTLAVRIRRRGWEAALRQGVLTDGDVSDARVHVQWDPERSLHGEKLNYRSIQVGLSRHVIREFVDDWVVAISDLSALVAKIAKLRSMGRFDRARDLLPNERVYPVDEDIRQRLGM